MLFLASNGYRCDRARSSRPRPSTQTVGRQRDGYLRRRSGHVIERLDLTTSRLSDSPPAAAKWPATSAGMAPTSRASRAGFRSAAVHAETDDNPGGVPSRSSTASAPARRRSLADVSATSRTARSSEGTARARPRPAGCATPSGCRAAGRPPQRARVHRGVLDRTSARTSTFDVPTLVIHGDDDQVVPSRSAAKAAAAREGAQLIVYHGAPHGITDTHKEQLCARPAGVPPARARPSVRGILLHRASAPNESRVRTGHDRPDPRLLGDAPQLGGLGAAYYEAQRLPRARRRRIRASRSRSRRSRRPVADRAVTVRRPRAPRGRRSSELERPPILMGHSFGGRAYAAPARPRLGAAGVAINSAPTEGVRSPRCRRSSRRSRCSRTRRTATRRSASRPRVALRLHQHAQRGGVGARSTSATTSRRRAAGLGVRPARELQAGPPGHVGELRERGARAAAVHRGRRRPHHAAVGEQVERQHYESQRRITEYEEFPGRSHWTCGEHGWEEVADHALEWAIEHAGGAR